MANVNGIRITLPNGQEYRGRGNLQVQIEHQPNWLLSGGNSVIGVAANVFKEIGGNGGRVKTPLATGHLGAAGGSRTFEIAFDQWEGNTDSWGPADPDDSVDEKMAVLDTEVARASVDSLSPATLEFGPFSSTSSRYDPIPVVLGQLSPSLDFESQTSVFRSRVTCIETVNLGEPIDGEGGVTEDYRLTPAGASTPRIPIAADTLGAGRRGTGEQTQGRATAASPLVDTNGTTGGDPTTLATKVLPTSLRLRGAFRGANAAELADRLKTEFLANDAVNEVDLSAPNQSGTDPLTGTYVIGAESSIDPIVPQVDGGVYGYTLDLQEA